MLDFLDIGRLDDDSNAQQQAFYRMAVVFANAYTDAISDNVRRSNHNKRLKGTIQKDSPLGYINEPRNRPTHPYPTLITKDVYDKCQEIRQSRGRGLAKANEEELKEQANNQTIVDKSTQRMFLYRGMIKCNSCNCTYSPEAKTKQVIKEEFKNTPLDTLTPDCYETKEYIYLRPVKRRNNCQDCKSTNEEYINI
jgi:hypothetical protein